MAAGLRDVQGDLPLRVGERQVTLYVVGAASEGVWAGLKTAAVEI
jgi:hypothetical protein